MPARLKTVSLDECITRDECITGANFQVFTSSATQFITGKDVLLSDANRSVQHDDQEILELIDAFEVMKLTTIEFERVDRAAKSYATHPLPPSCSRTQFLVEQSPTKRSEEKPSKRESPIEPSQKNNSIMIYNSEKQDSFSKLKFMEPKLLPNLALTGSIDCLSKCITMENQKIFLNGTSHIQNNSSISKYQAILPTGIDKKQFQQNMTRVCMSNFGQSKHYDTKEYDNAASHSILESILKQEDNMSYKLEAQTWQNNNCSFTKSKVNHNDDVGITTPNHSVDHIQTFSHLLNNGKPSNNVEEKYASLSQNPDSQNGNTMKINNLFANSPYPTGQQTNKTCMLVNRENNHGQDASCTSSPVYAHVDPFARCISWLILHLSSQTAISLSRSRLYEHWNIHAHNNHISHLNPVVFGAAVKTAFPDVTIRRLGCRGDSKYYFHGIGVKKESALYNALIVHQRINIMRDEMNNLPDEKAGMRRPPPPAVTPKYKSAAALKLPLLEELNLVSLDRSLAELMLMLLQVHGQRLIELILTHRIRQVPVTMATFWTNLPQSLSEGVATSLNLQMLALWCDLRLLSTLQDRLGLMEDGKQLRIPIASLLTLASELAGWVKSSVAAYPEELQRAREAVYETWCGMVKRICIIHELTTNITGFLHDKHLAAQSSHIWSHLDLSGLTISDADRSTLIACVLHFGNLIYQQVPLPPLMAWLRSVLITTLLHAVQNCTTIPSLPSLQQYINNTWTQTKSIITHQVANSNNQTVWHVCDRLLQLVSAMMANVFSEWTLQIRQNQCRETVGNGSQSRSQSLETMAPGVSSQIAVSKPSPVLKRTVPVNLHMQA